GEDHPPLGVGVQHFDLLAGVHRDHIAGTVRAARGHVLGHRQPAGHRHVGLTGGDREHGGGHRRGAGHVRGHLPHALRRLDGHTAGVERDPLADERDPGPGRPGRLVAQPHQPRRRLRTLADREDAAVPAPAQGPFVEHLHLQAGRGGGLGDLLGEVRRAQLVRRGVDPVPRPRDRLGGHLRVPQLRPGGAGPAPERTGRRRGARYAVNWYAPSRAPSASARTAVGPASSSGTGSANATRSCPARARTAAPAPRRRVSVGGAAPSGSGPSPTATTSGAVIVPNVASFVTSPTLPVAPSNFKVAVSWPSKAATTLSHPAATSSSASWPRSVRSRWCTPITIASTASSAGSVSKRLRRGSVTALIVSA